MPRTPAPWLTAARRAAEHASAPVWLATAVHEAGGIPTVGTPDPALSGLLAPLVAATRTDPGRLGDAYAATTRTGGRASGRYYTPRAVAERILATLPADARVLDPACGGGRFLLSGPDGGVGWDLDPVAAALARDAAALIGRTIQVQVRDTLLDFAQGRLPLGTFDAVVGNPPYRGGRHAQLAAHDALFRRAFATAEYQLDPYALFIEAGLALLRPGGRLALVVPNAWISNVRSGRLRGHLARFSIDAVEELPVDTFDAAVETVVLWARRAPRQGTTVPVTGPRGGTLHLSADRPEAPWALTRDDGAARILAAARNCPRQLGDVAEVTRGVNPYHHTTHTPDQIADRVHHSHRACGPDWVPDLRGRHLGAYRLWWSGVHWVHYGPWLKEPRAPRFFDGPRLVVRKILGDTLCAAYLDAPFCCDQSVYIARLTDPSWPAGALLAVVNSRFVARLVRARHQEDDRVFPQLKVAELRAVPLPPVDPRSADVARLAADAHALQAAEAASLRALDAEIDLADPQARHQARRQHLRAGWIGPDAQARAALRAAIEARVARLYGVDVDATEDPELTGSQAHVG